MSTLERPILFSGSMVRAILNDSKTQTRRIVKPQPSADMKAAYLDGDSNWVFWSEPVGEEVAKQWYPPGSDRGIKCPYGKVGDRLWVRETWRPAMSDSHECYAYKADDSYRCGYKPESEIDPSAVKWKPSIHMPRSVSRITLEITEIRIEQLQDISEEDAKAEGVPPFDWNDGWSLRPVPAFTKLWDSINGTKYPWSSNPWVWCMNFKRRF
jgi:hypothetical protein